MPESSTRLPKNVVREYRRRGPDCALVDYHVASLGQYFTILNATLQPDGMFWFRGHADFKWSLTPSALRFSSEADRNRALALLPDFKRFVEMRLDKVPGPDEELKWVQLAQHYGLKTRLLDWTRNAAIALYFACQDVSTDGMVLILNPVDLNRQVAPKKPRVFDARLDAPLIAPYLRLSGKKTPRGRRTIAINPTWNSDRIMLQQGVSTLHGSREFGLTREQARSLAGLPVSAQQKSRLLDELERVGVSEMSIFPEPEHVCHYLVDREGLR